MYIRKSTRTYKGKTYTNHLLVESVQTAKGPRQRTICSLGSLEPAPAEDWLGLAHKLQAALQGQESLSGSSSKIQKWVEKARNKTKSTARSDGERSTVTVEPDQVQIEQPREAGAVHDKIKNGKRLARFDTNGKALGDRALYGITNDHPARIGNNLINAPLGRLPPSRSGP